MRTKICITHVQEGSCIHATKLGRGKHLEVEESAWSSHFIQNFFSEILCWIPFIFKSCIMIFIQLPKKLSRGLFCRTAHSAWLCDITCLFNFSDFSKEIETPKDFEKTESQGHMDIHRDRGNIAVSLFEH